MHMGEYITIECDLYGNKPCLKNAGLISYILNII